MRKAIVNRHGESSVYRDEWSSGENKETMCRYEKKERLP